MAIRIPLLGFSIVTHNDLRREKEQLKSPVPPVTEDGALVLSPFSTGWKTYLDQEAKTKNEILLITKYRDISLIPEVDSAVDEIINEFMVIDDKLYPIELVLDNVPIPAKIKDLMREEFEYILSMLEFKKLGYEIVRKWYVDGRLFFHIVIDEEDPASGIKDLRYIDPRKIKKVREVVKDDSGQAEQIYKRHIEYFVYNEHGLFDPANGLRIAKDSIAYIHSGIIDQKTGSILSNLHKALKVSTSLTMLENSLVIYRLARAPERRVFYIDVSGMPTIKAEQYMHRLMNSMKNQITYDSSTGDVITNKRFSPMLEDFFLARRDAKGTEVQTLEGGKNLGQMEDVEYFKRKLYEALNVPVQRLQAEDPFMSGQATQITREEIKFNKFIIRLRNRFSDFLNQLLEIQVSLKGIMTRGDFEKIKQNIAFNYAEDNHFAELKNDQLIQGRLGMLQQADPNPPVGRYFSKEWIVKNVLHFTEAEWEDIKYQIDEEKANGDLEDSMMNNGMGPPGMLPPPGGGMPPTDPMAQQQPFDPAMQGFPGEPREDDDDKGGFPPKKKKPFNEDAVRAANELIEAVWTNSE